MNAQSSLNIKIKLLDVIVLQASFLDKHGLFEFTLKPNAVHKGVLVEKLNICANLVKSGLNSPLVHHVGPPPII